MIKTDSIHPFYVNGKWMEAEESIDLKSPYSGQVVATVPQVNREEVAKAIESAEQGAQRIKKLTALERSEILEKVSDLFKERAEEAARILASEAAKPLKAARAEIDRTVETYKFAAEEAKRITGETIPMDAAKTGKGRVAFTMREPLGIIAAITPFNFPFNLVAHKLGPAIAAGNAVVLKPANQTPLSALFTAKLFEEAGLPTGALNVVPGKGSVIGDVLVTDPRIKMVTFTGSYEVGLSLKEKAGLKKVTLELGSNSAVIVESTEDLDDVVKRCVQGAYAYAGQVCISIQRIYVNEALYETFLEKFIAHTNSLLIGDPLDEKTDVSALISKREAERISSWLEEAKSAGARIALGGKHNGAMMEPTIIVDGSEELSISCKEAFAPVVNITPYGSFDEAITFVNDSAYGLQAGVITNSIHQAFQAVHEIEVGGVMVNDIPTFRVDQMPYGGVKNSGSGREGIKYSVEEMTELKLVSFKL